MRRKRRRQFCVDARCVTCLRATHDGCGLSSCVAATLRAPAMHRNEYRTVFSLPRRRLWRRCEPLCRSRVCLSRLGGRLWLGSVSSRLRIPQTHALLARTTMTAAQTACAVTASARKARLIHAPTAACRVHRLIAKRRWLIAVRTVSACVPPRSLANPKVQLQSVGRSTHQMPVRDVARAPMLFPIKIVFQAGNATNCLKTPLFQCVSAQRMSTARWLLCQCTLPNMRPRPRTHRQCHQLRLPAEPGGGAPVCRVVSRDKT